MRLHGWAFALFVSAVAVACADSTSTPSAQPSDSTNGSGTSTSADALAAERDAILFTREEEKLARDVYGALTAQAHLFANIAVSEQQHMDQIGQLIVTYGLTDPAAGKQPGEFTNATLQSLYDALVATGQTSTLAALAVGVEIEELDIHDISGSTVVHQDVANVFANLTRGSRNHLRAFYAELTSRGGSYVPKYLDQATFDAIVTSPVEHGPTG